eukprot:CAMPEP_0195085010 /NCGR_PEP_ID=MMETSP0448-20130528/25535_1 /TAXON_ID=66468 /ORGANISM="Heterocapsa triquestra, Strain CCMP 448" /LENGTH=236 /DNA_ID=CAMNT_0040118383 /DNA_START=41 /DNA_END=748 /DNA_ORIENTATION=+
MSGSQSCRVYVGNIDWKISWQDLKDHMREAGEVTFADIFEERTGRSKGVAIVEYKTPEDAQAAISTLNDSQLGERLIFVREDRESTRKGGKAGFKGGGKGGYASYDSYGGYGGYGKGGYGKGGYGKGGYYDGGYGGKGKYGGYGKGKGGWGKASQPAAAPLHYGPRDKGRLVYVGNLPFRAAWQELKDVFKQHGEVIRVDIAQDMDGRSKGYATVLFEKEEEATAAIEALNEEDFQ